MSFAAMVGRRRRVVLPTVVEDDPEEPPPSTFTPNRPAGYTTFADTTFDGPPDAAWSFNSENVVPDSGPDGESSYAVVYPEGYTEGGPPGYTINLTTGALNAAEVYTAFSMMHSADFVQHDVGVKVIYPYRKTSGGSTIAAFMLITYPVGARDSGKCTFFFNSQIPSDNRNYYCNRNGYTQAAPYEMLNGTRYLVETQHVFGTPGVSNGVLRVWISYWTGTGWSTPVLVMEHTDVRHGEATDFPYWVGWRWDNYFGGAAVAPIPADQSRLFNRLHISIQEAA